ncbi:MAG: hypothetical protein OES24_01730 [Acidimicrobiia bacterium]|nr:hypothetical protein [Acidimicrobiia bacterium]
MRRFFIAFGAAILMCSVAAVGPAAAKAPERGNQVMVLNQDPNTGDFGLFGCPELSWFGTIELAGTTYGMGLYLPGRVTSNVLHYEEGWKVWTGSFTLSADLESGLLLLDECEPGEVVLSGLDKGTGSFLQTKFRSNGTVDEAYHPFADWLGRRVHQDGVLGPIEYQDLPYFGFYGDLRLN